MRTLWDRYVLSRSDIDIGNQVYAVEGFGGVQNSQHHRSHREIQSHRSIRPRQKRYLPPHPSLSSFPSPRLPFLCLHLSSLLLYHARLPFERNIPKLNLDYYSSITICDSTRSLVGTGLLCFFYRDNTDDLPQPMSTGEILIAYNMKIRPHNLDIQAWSTHTTRFKLISPGFDRHTLRPDESSLVMQMREWWNARGGAPGAKGEVIKRDKDGAVANEEGVSLSRKLKTISGLEVNSFYDLVCEVRSPRKTRPFLYIISLYSPLDHGNGCLHSFSNNPLPFLISFPVHSHSSLTHPLILQVVKTYPGDRPYTLYVTDYTQNTSLFSYQWSPGHNDWKGPYGKYTLQLSCWDHVATTASMCKPGGYYIFKNVRIKKYVSGPTTVYKVLTIEIGREILRVPLAWTKNSLKKS